MRRQYLKVRVETIELPDGRRIPDYCQLVLARDRSPRTQLWPLAIPSSQQQYRHGPRRVGLVFPGGHLEPHEAPQDAARQELFEETGFESDVWTYLGGYMVNSNQGGAVSHMFHATGCRRTATPRSDDLEETEILLLRRDELLAAIGRGEIHLLTQIALVSMVWQKDIAKVLAGR
jgi:ADP-ribose pyrophosphatase